MNEDYQAEADALCESVRLCLQRMVEIDECLEVLRRGLELVQPSGEGKISLRWRGHKSLEMKEPTLIQWQKKPRAREPGGGRAGNGFSAEKITGHATLKARKTGRFSEGYDATVALLSSVAQLLAERKGVIGHLRTAKRAFRAVQETAPARVEAMRLVALNMGHWETMAASRRARGEEHRRTADEFIAESAAYTAGGHIDGLGPKEGLGDGRDGT